MVRDTFSWQSKKGPQGEGQTHDNCVIKDFRLSFNPDDLIDYQIHELTTHFKNGTLIKDYTNQIKLLELDDGEKGVNIALSQAEIYSTDGVYVLSCRSSYKIPKSKFFGVKMSYPTKDFKLTIAYPLKHKIYFEYFSQKVPRIQQDILTYIVHFDGWILANEGFIFQIRSD